MTADETRELFGYNSWANRLLFDAAATLSDELYHRDLKSSFGGIHGTLAHIVWAEQLWLCRWLGRSNPAVPQGRDLGSLAAVRARWEEVEAERRAFLHGLSDAGLAETRTVKPRRDGPPRGGPFQLPPRAGSDDAQAGRRGAADHRPHLLLP